jgi:hypothetical protein
MGGTFTASHSADGSTWVPVTDSTPQTIGMSSNVYVGLALTSHNAGLTCEAVFSNVTITGNVTGQWMHQDIGIQSNDPEPMYVAIANSNGAPAVVYHDDPDAAQIDTWTEWNIDLKEFQDKGINLTDVDSIALGFGDRNNPQVGGAGKMYFDDLRLYRARYVPGKGTPLEGDFNADGVVDYGDLEIMTNKWLNEAETPSPANLIAQYDFEGNVQDKSGNGNHGTLIGDASVTMLQLDGDGDAVNVGDSSMFNPTGSLSISAWINMSSWGGNWGNVILSKRGENDLGWQFRRHGGNQNLTFTLRGTSGADDPQGTIEPPLNEWIHVAAVYDADAGLRTVYINSIVDVQIDDSGTVASCPHDVYIGARATDDNAGQEGFFDGQIDDLSIYGRALSPGEVFSLAGGSPPDLDGDMKIDFKDYAVLVDQWLDEQLWPEW